MRPGVICTPLRAEWTALYRATAAPVSRTGRGPRRRLSDPAGPIAVAGVAGALDPALRPGDIVVADEIRGDTTVAPSPAGVLVYRALRGLGLPVRLGPVYSATRVVHGPRRDTQGGDALAVDTESAFLAAQIPAGRTVVVRTIVDTPRHPLLRPGTPWRGIVGLRALRACAPALDLWAAATGARELIHTDPWSLPTVARSCDLVLVLGPLAARQTQRLVDLAPVRTPTFPLADTAELDLRRLAGARRIAVATAAGAARTAHTDLARTLSALGPITVHTRAASAADDSPRRSNNPPREVS
jgi:4-hydroxy-3-methylbut-2-enyl diphosphate reductase